MCIRDSLYTVVVEPQPIERLKAEQPELPNAKTIRYLEDYQLPLTDINLFIENPDKADFFEACMGNGKLKPRTVSNWILVDITCLLYTSKREDLLASAPQVEAGCFVVPKIVE